MAKVEEGASVGDNVSIHHQSFIRTGASIGNNCIIGSYVYIDCDVSIGNGVKIQNHTSIYKKVVIDDDVFIGPGVMFTNVKNPRAFIERKEEMLATRVREGASIGARSVIVCGNIIGKFSFLGAGSVLTKSMPDHSLFAGNPAKQIGWVTRNGHFLRSNQSEYSTFHCDATGDTYRYSLQEFKVDYSNEFNQGSVQFPK